MVLHYNGTNWKNIYETNANQILYSVAVKTNKIIAVGQDNTIFPGKALILIGERQ